MPEGVTEIDTGYIYVGLFIVAVLAYLYYTEIYQVQVKTIADTKTALDAKTAELVEATRNLTNTAQEVTELKQKLANKSAELQNTVATLAARTSELQNTSSTLAGRTSELQNTAFALAARTSELQQTTSMLSTRSSELQNTRAELAARTSDLSNRTSELSSRNSELAARTAELNTRTTDLGNKNAELAARNVELQNTSVALANKTSELNSRTVDLSNKVAELLAIRQRTCSLTNAEAQQLGISGYSQETCNLNQNFAGLNNVLNMSSDALLDAMVAISTLPPNKKASLAKMIGGLKQLASTSDIIFNVNMNNIRTNMFNMLASACQGGTVGLDTRINTTATMFMQQVFGFPQQKKYCNFVNVYDAKDIIQQDMSAPSAMLGEYKMSSCWSTSESGGLYRMAEKAGSRVDQTGYILMMESIQETLQTFAKHFFGLCNVDRATAGQQMETLLADLTSFYMRLKNSIITVSVSLMMERVKYI